VVSQRELARVRVEVRLPSEVLDRVHAHVMADERHRNDQRHHAASILLDQRCQLPATCAVNGALQESRHVCEHVRVPPASGDPLESSREPFGVALRHLDA
jgi:hypothetical protein